nr:hypothetical protein [Roseivivax marinus]
MDVIRPEVRALLGRWAEALVGAGVVALGVLWASGSGGWLGWAVVLAGLALTFAGVQRGRFRTGGGGPGIVDVTEGRIAYFGPLSGGVTDLDSIRALSLDATGRPAHWHLDREGDAALFIPVTAQGADALFDAFAALPGLDTERMLRALRRPGTGVTVIWRRSPAHHPAIGLH